MNADAAQFAPVGAGTTPITLDPARPVTRTYRDWQNPTDAFVGVYAYSPATFIGTFPVVNGNVDLTNVKLPSNLATGAHQLLFQCQTSKTLAVVAFTVPVIAVATTTPATSTAATSVSSAGLTPTSATGTADQSLPSTGTHSGALLAVAGLLLLVGGSAVVIGRPRRSRQH